MISIQKQSKPDINQFEITLIGTGGGYGESLAIHLPGNNWIIVDSCKNPKTGEVLPLEYLKQAEAKCEDVKLIVCTHWHDDHILGMSDLVKACTNAKFCFAKVNDLNKFLFMLNLDHRKSKRSGSISSTEEFIKCLDAMNGRMPIGAYPDRLISRFEFNSTVSEIFSLSPSDHTIQNFDLEISKLITEYGHPSKKIVPDSPNDKSVVLYIKCGNHVAILGADLEVSNVPTTGWFAILDHTETIGLGLASYFKIPHHGSKNGYHIRIWEELLEENPNSSLTPWNKSNALPTQEMLQLYKNHTDKLSITSEVIEPSNPKKRDKDITKLIKRFNHNLAEVKFSEGLIRSRINQDQAIWTIETFGTARNL